MKINRKIAARAAVPALALGLSLAACSSGGGSPSNSPAPSSTAGQLALTCKIGWDNPGTGEQFVTTQPPGQGQPADIVQVTVHNTGSSLVSVDAVNVDAYDAQGNVVSTVSVPLTVQG